MEVVIKIIIHGSKNYLSLLEGSGSRIQESKNPFADPQILKFTIDDALSIIPRVKTSWDHAKKVVAVTNDGRELPDVYNSNI